VEGRRLGWPHGRHVQGQFVLLPWCAFYLRGSIVGLGGRVVVAGDVEVGRGNGYTLRAILCGNRFRLEESSLAGDVDARAGCRCIVAGGTVLTPVVGQGLFGGRTGRCGNHRIEREDRNCLERVVAVWVGPGFVEEGSLRLVSIDVPGDFVWDRLGILPAPDTGCLHRQQAAMFLLPRNSVHLQYAVRTHVHANKVVESVYPGHKARFRCR
jgi:hypothetical protein